jgi:hypothetical protein
MKRQVISTRETQKLTPTRELERWVTVEYMLDDFGPFTFEAKKADFSWERVRKDMDVQEQGLKSVSS